MKVSQIQNNLQKKKAENAGKKKRSSINIENTKHTYHFMKKIPPRTLKKFPHKPPLTLIKKKTKKRSYSTYYKKKFNNFNFTF